MSDSTDNTNELDSYGVWVKNTKQDEGTDDGLNFADSLDLPDFEENDSLDDSDFSDMFKEDDSINLDTSSDDTTLTDDELMNITSGDGIEIAEAEVEPTNDSLDEVDFSSEIGEDFNVDDNPLEENSVTDAELDAPSFDEFVTEEEPAQEVQEEAGQETASEDVSLDDFVTDDFAAPEATEEAPAQPAAEEDVSDDFGLDSNDDGEEEISLDDFMDNGFSDESVASGNNGFAADAGPAAAASEEVSLDDFVDMSEFGVSEEAPKKEEAIADEKPLDMDISFDSSADTIETEENIENEADFDSDDTLDNDFEEEAAEAFTSQESEETESTNSNNDIEAEEVDLSDFGIDADAEETPVTQDIEGSKTKDTIVDYDLSVSDGNMNAAPVVNEIKSSAAEESSIESVEEIAPAAAMSAADSSLLQQIVADLSSLKAEINTLKNNLEEIKAAPAPAAADTNSIISEEIAIEEDDSSKEDTGFFSGDDGDDTIALSTDELSNILNTADFSSEESAEGTEAEVPAQEEVQEDFAVEEEAPVQEEVTEDFTVEEEAPSESVDNFLADEDISTTAAEAVNFEEPAGNQEDLTYDFTDDNLSEPNIDEIEIDEGDLEDDLPDEISIPKEDDIFVESSSSDFMDSVQDTTEEHEQEETAPAADESFSTVDNLFDEQPAEEAPEQETAAQEPVFEETVSEEVASEEPVFEESFAEEAPAQEPLAEESEEVVIEPEVPVDEETFVSEEEVAEDNAIIPDPNILENDFISHEDDNNILTDSNIDYLTTEEKEEAAETDENAELKKDIKSVLLYMDQLLENLPEEKIVEFAKSDEFTTYKKLFSELGLS